MFVLEVKENNGISGLFLRGEIIGFGKCFTGSTVFSLTGEVLDHPTQTSIKIGDGKHIEDYLGRFINHSCNPSVEISGREVVAIRDLEIGDEVTFNYLENEDELVVPFECSCCGKLIK
jgi:hypothetical protein